MSPGASTSTTINWPRSSLVLPLSYVVWLYGGVSDFVAMTALAVGGAAAAIGMLFYRDDIGTAFKEKNSRKPGSGADAGPSLPSGVGSECSNDGAGGCD